jgi:hypothetical protein
MATKAIAGIGGKMGTNFCSEKNLEKNIILSLVQAKRVS